MKHFPGLYRRKNGLYGFAKQADGVRTFHSLNTHDLEVAIKRASQLTGSPINPSEAGVADYIDAFLSHKAKMKRYSEASAHSKRAVLNKFATFALGPATKVSRATVQAFYNEQLNDGLAPDTALGYLAVARAFFNWLRDVKEARHDNPCDGIQIARVSTRARRDFCTPEQVEKLINECPREDLKFVLYCGFHCGLRKNEIIEARPFWFDVNRRQLHLRKHDGIQFKDGEERSLPLTSEFAEFLRVYGLREPYMLHPEVTRGKSLYRYDFKRPFADYAKAQGCEWVTPHVMRHTYASLLASAGENIFDIAVWLGDGVKVVQKHYAKLLPVQRDVGRAFRSSAATLRAQSG